MELFTLEREKSWSEIDSEWDIPKFQKLRQTYGVKAAMYKGVAFFENYIPLFRFSQEEDLFTKAESGTVYAWNFDDLPESEFKKIVEEAKKEFGLTDVCLESDPSGF
jgi:hypothetical protein